LLLRAAVPWVANSALPLLAIERARRVPHGAAIAVSGVVASLSLAVALTVMVASFRQSVTQWLDTVLPATLYVRSAGSASSSETAFFDPRYLQAASTLVGVQRVRPQRTIALTLAPDQPSVTLLVRDLHPAPDQADGADAGLPLVGEARAVPEGQIGIYVSEAMVDLYGARVGQDLPSVSAALQALRTPGSAQVRPLFVAGVWRDYARQFGTVVLDTQDFALVTNDSRVNDLALWLAPGTDETAVQGKLRALADTLGGPQASDLLDFGSAGEIRQRTLQIFDRSFAVTYWLQAVAIGIGLFGVAASFSAQVLARRKEFGLLLHLGLTRAQVLRLLALEGAAWTSLGAVAGTLLGLAVASVLVFVVNPQSFHWTMDLSIPWPRLLSLDIAVTVAGTATAWIAGLGAAGSNAVQAVKEDW
jgi:putative ABC transport system permease protein